MNKIINNNHKHCVKFAGHDFEKYYNHYQLIEKIAEEQNISIKEATNKLLDFILGTLDDNNIINYQKRIILSY